MNICIMKQEEIPLCCGKLVYVASIQGFSMLSHCVGLALFSEHENINGTMSLNPTITSKSINMCYYFNVIFTCSPTTFKTGTRLTWIKQKLLAPVMIDLIKQT